MVQDTRLIELKGISKSFGETKVLHNIDLYIRKCEFITLLGPSGCGKTTLLRIIGGFETPDTGSVLFEGADMTPVPPYKRRINTVFQKYALFTHLNVFDNIAFGLNLKAPEALGVKTRKQKKEEINRRVTRMLKLVKMEGYEKRSIDQLSGGQQQRIAIARALVNEPEVLLLDEPLGALDLKLRRQMQQELKDIQRRLGIAFIYITHDQEEALNMSDRIAIMRDGHFEQIGTPEEIYERPKTRFAAFIGQTNLLEATVAEKDGRGLILNYAGMFIPARNADFDVQIGDSVALSLRTERIGFSKKPVGECNLPGTLRSRHYAGGSMRAVIVLDDGREITVLCQSGERAEGEIGERVFLSWNRDEAPVVR